MEADVPEIAALHRRIWGEAADYVPVPAEYFGEILFRNPCQDGTLDSLVYEDDDGRLVGCLGVMPRRMVLGDRGLRVAISHNFMVDPDSRVLLAGVHLMRTFFAGPQEVSLCEGNDASRKVWEGLGGRVALLYSLRWTRPLRPLTYVLLAFGARGGSRGLAALLRGLGGAVDSVATRAGWSPFRQAAPETVGEELTGELVCAHVAELSRGWRLRPEYEPRALGWVLDMVARKRSRGRLHRVMVRARDGAPLGWYLYFANRGGISEVVQLVARDDGVDSVLAHLLHDAWTEGAVALSGALEPRFTRELSERSALFRDAGRWTLVHSRDPELVRCFLSGEALLTGLDGEWWINP